MILSPYFQMLQAVIVQDAVTDTFTGCAFAVYLPVLFGIPWNAGMEAEVTVILYVDGAPVVSGGGDTVLHGSRNLYVRILAGSGICAHPLWDHCPMEEKSALLGRFGQRFGIGPEQRRFRVEKCAG